MICGNKSGTPASFVGEHFGHVKSPRVKGAKFQGENHKRETGKSSNRAWCSKLATEPANRGYSQSRAALQQRSTKKEHGNGITGFGGIVGEESARLYSRPRQLLTMAGNTGRMRSCASTSFQQSASQTGLFMECAVKTPEEYLQLTTQHMEAAQITSRWIYKSTETSFNDEQCKYLAHKLRRAVFFANWFFDFEFPRSMFARPENEARCLELSRILFLLAKEVVCFIQGCSKEPWIQAAVILSNMSDHVLSLGFDLELCTISITYLTRPEGLKFLRASDLRTVEAQIAKEKAACLDHATLWTKVKALIESGEASTDEYELATFLFQRLNNPRPLGKFESWAPLNFSERSDLTKLKQMVKIGTGASGTVHKAIWRGVEVAVKTFHGPENPDFKKEVSICTRLSHPNIASFLFCGVEYGECLIVMELMDEDLQSLIRTRLRCNRRRESPFCMFVALDLMLQIGEGLSYLHKMRIVHGDLKSQNILVRRKNSTKLEGHECIQAKVADFGLSRTKENSMTYSNQTPNMGTLRWMAPEMFRHESIVEEKRYPFKSDVYSFAMVCYEILTGNFPFQAIHSYIEVKNKVLSGEHPRLPRQCPMELRTLIEKCWSQEASARPCFTDICEFLRYVKILQISGTSEVLTSVAYKPSPLTTAAGSLSFQPYGTAYACLLISFKQKLQELLVIYSYNIPLEKFLKVYKLRFQKDLDPQYFGATSLDALLQKVPDVAVLQERTIKGKTEFHVVAVQSPELSGSRELISEN